MAKKKPTIAELKKAYKSGKVKYSTLMSHVLADNSRKIAAAVTNISDDHYKKAISKKSKRIMLPPIDAIIPKKSMILNKTAVDGQLITNTLKQSLIDNLRTAMEEHASTHGRGAVAGRVNPKLVEAFEKKATETFQNYTENNPRLGMPANIHTIAVGEVRSTVNQTKDYYTREFVKMNPQYVMRKRWIHNPKLSKKPRPHHAEAQRDYADGIPVNENFVLSTGVSLRYPHDPKAPIEETASCNCDVDYYLVEVEETPQDRLDQMSDNRRSELGSFLLESVSKSADVEKAAAPIGTVRERKDGHYKKISETEWVKVPEHELTDATREGLSTSFDKKHKFMDLKSLLADDSVKVMLNSMKIDPTTVTDRKELLGKIKDFVAGMKTGESKVESAPAAKEPKTPTEKPAYVAEGFKQSFNPEYVKQLEKERPYLDKKPDDPTDAKSLSDVMQILHTNLRGGVSFTGNERARLTHSMLSGAEEDGSGGRYTDRSNTDYYHDRVVRMYSRNEYGAVHSPNEIKRAQAFAAEIGLGDYKTLMHNLTSHQVPVETRLDTIEKVLHHFNNSLKKNSINVRFPSANTKNMIKEGRSLNLFHGKKGRGSTSLDARNRWEGSLLAGPEGAVEGAKVSKNVAGVGADKRPTYGSFNHGDDYYTHNMNVAEQYGDFSLTLHTHVNQRATFTIGNSSGMVTPFSVDSFAGHSPADRAGLAYAHVFKSIMGGEYTESQIWGGIDYSKDVKKIIAPPAYAHPDNETLKTKIIPFANKFKLPVHDTNGKVIYEPK